MSDTQIDPLEVIGRAENRDEADPADYDAFHEGVSVAGSQLNLRAAHLANASRERVAQRQALVAEGRKLAQPYWPEHQAKIAAFDQQTAEQFEPALIAQVEKQIELATKDVIMQRPPTYPPRDERHALEVNGIAADAPSYSPAVFEQVARAALLNGDSALVKRLYDVGRSLASYKQPFGNSVAITTVLADMRNALRTPAVRRSDAAKAWKANALRDLQTLRQSIRDNTVDVYVSTGALGTLFPDRRIP